MDSNDDRYVSPVSSHSNVSSNSGRQFHHVETVDQLDDSNCDDSFINRKAPRWMETQAPLDNLQARENSSFNSRAPDKSGSKPGMLGALKDWWLEILCCILAVGSLVSIAAILLPYDGRPLPKWPYNLSINSIISIFVVVMKASIYLVLSQGLSQLKWAWFKQTRPLYHLESFDDASRGPLGALKLLRTVGGRHPVTSIGAIIVITALVIDPFAQQLTRYYSCDQISSSIASIPRTNAFLGSPGDNHAGAGIVSIGLGMQSAINSGIFSPGNTRISANCPTGNCTFPTDYKTMGYCASCVDVSSELNMTVFTGTTGDNTTYVSGVNATLPSGLTAMAGYQSFIQNFDSNGTIEAILNVYNGTGPMYPDFACSDEFQWGCNGYGAARCSISPCIRAFTASVQAGDFVEEEMTLDEGTADIFGGDFLMSALDMPCLSESEKSKLQEAGYQFNDTMQWLPYNLSIPAGMTAEQQAESNSTYPIDINASCVYQYYSYERFSINLFLSQLFTGFASIGVEANGQSSNSLITLMVNGGNVSTPSIESNFRNVTDAMTAYIRQTNGGAYTSNLVFGQAHQSTTCVHVRWWWLSLPVVLLVLTLGFFVAMVLQTRSRQAMTSGSQNYKSSVLPLMFHGLESGATEKFGLQKRGTAEMENASKKLHVRLQPTEKGWKFVES